MSSTYPNKIWKTITVTVNGEIQNLCFMNLPNDKIEEFVDFQMKFFVRDEMLHKISGVADNSEALAEYRSIYKNLVLKPSCINMICSVEHQNGPSIVAARTIKLIRRGDSSEFYIPENVKSKEIQMLSKMARYTLNMYPARDVMKKYDLASIFVGVSVSVHPDYRKLGIIKEFYGLMPALSKEYGVPMFATLLTSLGTQKAAERSGWETAYEISRDQLSKMLNKTLDDNHPSQKYMICKI